MSHYITRGFSVHKRQVKSMPGRKSPDFLVVRSTGKVGVTAALTLFSYTFSINWSLYGSQVRNSGPVTRPEHFCISSGLEKYATHWSRHGAG